MVYFSYDNMRHLLTILKAKYIFYKVKKKQIPVPDNFQLTIYKLKAVTGKSHFKSSLEKLYLCIAQQLSLVTNCKMKNKTTYFLKVLLKTFKKSHG